MKKNMLKQGLMVLAAAVVTSTAVATGTAVTPVAAITAQAAVPGIQEYASGATTEEEVIRRINEIIRVFPEGSYATTDNEKCNHGSKSSCGKCNYKSVMESRLGISATKDGSTAWTCMGFRSLVYEYVFREQCSITKGNPEKIASGTLEQVMQEAHAGDVLKLDTHYAVVTVVDGEKYLYHANGDKKMGTSYVLLQPYRNYYSTGKNNVTLYRNSTYAEALNSQQAGTTVPEAGIPQTENAGIQTGENMCWIGVPDGIYEIRTALDHYYALAIAGNSNTDGANVQLSGGSYGCVQRFRITSVGGGLYTIVNVASGKALDVAAGGKDDEKNVRQSQNTNNASQLWVFEYGSRGGALLRNVGTGLYLDVDNAWTCNGTNVKAFVRNPLYGAQEWFFYTADTTGTV